MLLYPGNKSNNDFVPYRNQEFDSTEHQCKLGFVNVLDGEGKLDQKIGEEVLRLVG